REQRQAGQGEQQRGRSPAGQGPGLLGQVEQGQPRPGGPQGQQVEVFVGRLARSWPLGLDQRGPNGCRVGQQQQLGQPRRGGEAAAEAVHQVGDGLSGRGKGGRPGRVQRRGDRGGDLRAQRRADGQATGHRVAAQQGQQRRGGVRR